MRLITLSYIEEGFLWKLLLALPVNLILFCLCSTFDTLPSPSNVKLWRISSEASCFLCNKTICITAYILEACNVAFKQGDFTIRHDNVLSHVFATLNRFYVSVLPIPKDFIKFVRNGARAPRRRSIHSGILHHALDWKLIRSTWPTLPTAHVAFTQLHSDIVIFSNSTKKVILIALTCPCE